ncbi:MAG TPA: hypothetical protein PK636_02815 [bacterium]|nr:hypothetical protein [bacterium]HPJ71597.1 hypothetical protein [bacterium]HPQ65980.1 hypothetical protein [bacterium]
MELKQHITLSAAAAAVTAFFTRSLAAGLACFLAGVLIDLDHVTEYVATFGPRIKIHAFFEAAHYHIYRRYYLPLHSWELAAGTWLLWIFVLPVDWLLGAAVGVTLHLFADQLWNPARGATYFLIWRALHGFRSEIVFPPEKVILAYPYLIDRYR